MSPNSLSLTNQIYHQVKFLKLLLIVMTAGLCNLSCNKDELKNLKSLENKNTINSKYITLDGVTYKVLNEAEILNLNRNGISLECNSRAHDCKWSDNQGGSINCEGGTCAILQTQNPNYTWSACIGCYIAEQLDHAGACR